MINRCVSCLERNSKGATFYIVRFENDGVSYSSFVRLDVGAEYNFEFKYETRNGKTYTNLTKCEKIEAEAPSEPEPPQDDLKDMIIADWQEEIKKELEKLNHTLLGIMQIMEDLRPKNLDTFKAMKFIDTSQVEKKIDLPKKT